MAGERDLGVLLQDMRPLLNPGRFVFCTVSGPAPSDRAVVTVREPEGTTLVLEQAEADASGLAYDYVAAWITLRVHSALEAVGLTAAVSNCLAERGISCNVVAGFHHDHLFVPAVDAERAMTALAALAGPVV